MSAQQRCPRHGFQDVEETFNTSAPIVGGGHGYTRVNDYTVRRLACGCELVDQTGSRVEHD